VECAGVCRYGPSCSRRETGYSSRGDGHPSPCVPSLVRALRLPRRPGGTFMGAPPTHDSQVVPCLRSLFRPMPICLIFVNSKSSEHRLLSAVFFPFRSRLMMPNAVMNPSVPPHASDCREDPSGLLFPGHCPAGFSRESAWRKLLG